MHTYCGKIRTCLHSRKRHIITEVEMCSVRLVRKKIHSVCVCKIGYLLNIRAYSVIGRIIYKYRLCVGVFEYRLFNILDRHSQRYAQLLVYSGINVNRHRSAENKRIYRTAVYVTGHYYLLATLCNGKRHSLHCGCRSVYYKECVLCAESLCGYLFRFFYYGNRVTEVIERL